MLIDKTGDLGPTYLGIPRQAMLSEVFTDGVWRMRRRGRRVFGEVYDAIEGATAPAIDAGRDFVLWRHGDDDFKNHFSTQKTWDQIRVRKPEVPWRSLGWFTQGVPRQSFIVWLAFRDRLSTGVRMRQWGITQGCMFCGEPNEDRDHLFFACPFTYTLWLKLTSQLLGNSVSPAWSTTVTALLRSRRDKLDGILLKLVFQTAIYFVWRERNSRRHQGVRVDGGTLARRIDRFIRHRILSLKYTGSHKLAGLLRRWFEVYTG
ncbi:uncharacterized protein LOC130511263 [Raphanus sativus]|uniref:Uncharacterized protein LOC130511263 n=1 Tax=Raphanus sativus TaxID=3726 RepID=A0A9W3DKL0_RAPSA|nr:uncharacterized protein LOC130511263 [Raphanus sativus]